MAERVTAEEAIARLRVDDTMGMALATGQPPTVIGALASRDDWTNLRLSGALLSVWSEAFKHPNVHYLSGFFGPIERALRDQGANLSFAPADFRRFTPLLARLAPRVMITICSAPDADGFCSLTLHAGASVDELHRAGADPDRLLIAEASPHWPRTHGAPPEHMHRLHVDEIDLLVETDSKPLALDDAEPTDADRSIAECAATFIPEGATLQTGIGSIPGTIAGILADGDCGGFGVHSEMFTTGLMRLHQAGKVVNDKEHFRGKSVTTFAFGSDALYEWLDDNEEVAFLPVDIVNSPAVIRDNPRAVTINGAIAIDIHGQVVADTIGGAQFSGIGGHEDFVGGPGLSLDDRSLICLPSTVTINGERKSRIAPWFDAGTVVTTPRHQVDVVITEYGPAELMGLTVRQRGEALAKIAHPDFRDGLMEAAERASGGRSPLPAP